MAEPIENLIDRIIVSAKVIRKRAEKHEGFTVIRGRRILPPQFDREELQQMLFKLHAMRKALSHRDEVVEKFAVGHYDETPKRIMCYHCRHYHCKCVEGVNIDKHTHGHQDGYWGMSVDEAQLT